MFVQHLLKRSFALIAAILLCAAAFPAAVEAGFSDVSAASAAQSLQNSGVIDAKGGQRFFPNKTCTRANFLAWALAGAGQGPLEGGNNFLDAGQNGLVTRALKIGAVQPTERFYPHIGVRRVDALKMLLAIEGIGHREGAQASGIADLPTDEAERSAIARGLELGLLPAPRGVNRVEPYATLNRQQCAELVFRAAQLRSGTAPGTNTARVIVRSSAPADSRVDQVLSLLENGLSTNASRAELEQAALSAAAKASGDQYAEFFSPQEVSEFLTGVGMGDLFGIGVFLSENEQGEVVVIRPIPGGAAARAGVRAGDVFVGVDGADVRGETVEQIQSRVLGEAGTAVRVQFFRPRVRQQVEFLMTREAIRPPDIETSIVDGAAVIRMNFFGEQTPQNLLEALENNRRAAEKVGVVLDLRGNSGGLLSAAVSAAGVLLSANTLVAVVESPGKRTRYVTDGTDGAFAMVPLVVLVDAFSASASEILAGALRTSLRAKVIGQQTFGKGSVQDFTTFSDGSAIKYTTAIWKLSNGQSVDGSGIVPDVKLGESTLDNETETLRRATQLLRNGRWVPSEAVRQ